MITCPFCAESIQDAALVCRYCQANRVAGHWQPPGMASTGGGGTRPGHTTFVLAAVSLAAAAGMELYHLAEPVPLAGALRGGAVAIAWHLVYATAWAAMAVAFARRPTWGLRAIMGGTLLYAVDALLFVFDDAARHAMIASAVGGAEMLDLIDPDLADQGAIATRLAMLACWVVLAGYAWVHRASFTGPVEVL